MVWYLGVERWERGMDRDVCYEVCTLWNCSKQGVGGDGEEQERAHVGREYGACR
jgi:hypothetical protein